MRWPRARATLGALAPGDAGEERLAGVLADHVARSLRERAGEADPAGWAVLLAAPGTVITPIPGVNNGLRQAARVLHRVRRTLRSRVGLVRVGWLNHTRGGRWTTPSVPDALAAVRARGFEKLAYFPWGFTTDNAETILEGRIALRDMPDPFPRVEHLPCLNDDAAFIDLIAAAVRRSLACPAPADPAPEHAPGPMGTALSA
jgi:hypothetical protein